MNIHCITVDYQEQLLFYAWPVETKELFWARHDPVVDTFILCVKKRVRNKIVFFTNKYSHMDNRACLAWSNCIPPNRGPSLLPQMATSSSTQLNAVRAILEGNPYHWLNIYIIRSIIIRNMHHGHLMPLDFDWDAFWRKMQAVEGGRGEGGGEAVQTVSARIPRSDITMEISPKYCQEESHHAVEGEASWVGARASVL